MGAFQVCCMGLANVSVQFLNYPTHILFKSAKPVPSLLLGACYLRKKYANIDYTANALMIAGMALFVIADDQELDEELELKGFILVTIALLAEVTIGSVQEKVVKDYKSGQEEIILYTHLAGSVFLFLICLVTGELGLGIEALSYQPELLVAIAVFSLAGYFGAAALKNLVKYCGAMAALLTTTSRKMLAILLSVIIFPKVWSFQYWLGTLCYLTGTLLSSQATKMRLRAWLGVSWVGQLLQLDSDHKRKARKVLK
mmetsp:Transcript_8878/g.14033  ORF Transcript_8878/g.14033 Transcript_8878/m.14033 type:complete len:256 (+) Transcript_8878:47-814(+)